MRNYRMTVQYDGSNYNGWQIQPELPTVQGEIEKALATLLRKETTLYGSGRTDTGVHALGQVANFRAEQALDIFRFQYALNSLLPADIAVKDMQQAPDDFHSRFSAKKRSYLYLVHPHKTPFYHRWSYHLHPAPDIGYLNRMSKLLIGNQDFTSFTKQADEADSTRCILTDAHWRTTGGLTLFYIEANRFLHGMVRAITGTLLALQKEPGGEDKLQAILAREDRTAGGTSVPAKGLFLYKVKYE